MFNLLWYFASGEGREQTKCDQGRELVDTLDFHTDFERVKR